MIKSSLLVAFVLGAILSADAQVIFRNDFVIGKHARIKNKGLSFISINLDRHQNLNQLINGRGGRSLVIDVNAIRNPKRVYSYSEIAEKVYTPGPVYRPGTEPVPMFLLMPPPRPLTISVYHGQ
ncbi:MAG TPA: hypothetical protein VG737_02505 [Cyclobacteriaceae bacterium]|nr:hypothetical protein [Cyclobacteriaceae bacterium]